MVANNCVNAATTNKSYTASILLSVFGGVSLFFI